MQVHELQLDVSIKIEMKLPPKSVAGSGLFLKGAGKLILKVAAFPRPHLDLPAADQTGAAAFLFLTGEMQAGGGPPALHGGGEEDNGSRRSRPGGGRQLQLAGMRREGGGDGGGGEANPSAHSSCASSAASVPPASWVDGMSVQAALQALAPSFVRLVAEDYKRWVTRPGKREQREAVGSLVDVTPDAS